MDQRLKAVAAEAGERLREAMVQRYGGRERSASDLARDAGLSVKTIYRYLEGERLPSGEEIYRLMHLLPGQLEWVLTGRRPRAMDTLPPVLRRAVDLLLDQPISVQVVLAEAAWVLAHVEGDIRERLIDVITAAFALAAPERTDLGTPEPFTLKPPDVSPPR